MIYYTNRICLIGLVMQIGILGINHKSADLPLRERLAKACACLFGGKYSLHAHFSWVLLSTCNRTEIYFHSDDPTQTHTYILNALRLEIEEEFEHRIYTYFGSDCFFHLARVTAGVDSALIGETEIQGQVKRASETSAIYRTLASELHFLFQKCLKIGKNIRSDVRFTQDTLSIEEAVWNAAAEELGDLQRKKILFIGLSEINYKILSRFKREGNYEMTLCNRTDLKAEILSKREGIPFLAWKNLSFWIHFDLIILGTKCPYFLINPHEAKKATSPKLLIDLSVPRNVDPRLGYYPQMTLLNIDQLNQALDTKRKLKAQEMARIETQLISQAVEKQASLFKLKALRRAPLLAQVS
jgi:glutamyl-tRNA reductase